MTNNTEQPAKTYREIYVTISKNGKPRYSHWSRGRLFPITREVAEASFVAGATVYRKTPGVNVFADGGVEVFIG